MSDRIDPVEDRSGRDASDRRPSGSDAAPRPSRGLNTSGKVKRTRVSAVWVGLVTAAVLALIILIFIAQNSQPVNINFLGWDGQISLALALLFSALGGVLIVAIPGAGRIIQLRRALQSNARH